MTPHFHTEQVTIHEGDCIDVMRQLPANSVDAVVTDPPYGLEFMGKEWDSFKPAAAHAEARTRRSDEMDDENKRRYIASGVNTYAAGRPFQAWCELWATEALRVLKPGGHLLAFGGTRTFHRLTAGIEDAGFEIRDSIAWLYGSGFPKSLDVSKAIDGAADYKLKAIVRRAAVDAVERAGLALPGNSKHDWTKGAHAPGDKWWAEFMRWLPALSDLDRERVERSTVATVQKSAGWFTSRDIYEITAPATDDSAKWQGWGTALKPAFEPVVVARKPLTGTVAANVLQWGTGALNIDASRITATDPTAYAAKGASVVGLDSNRNGDTYGEWTGKRTDSTSQLGRWPANVVLDEHTAPLLDAQSGVLHTQKPTAPATMKSSHWGGGQPSTRQIQRDDGDATGASRFFYTAKASTDERPNVDGIAHPTVKPVDLMRWLVKLVTPKGGTVLEPFAGSGTTVEAAVLEGFRCIAIEREADYLPLIMQRVSKPHAVGLDFGDWEDVS